MSIYDKQRVKQLVEEQIKKDLSQDYEMSRQEFEMFFILFKIVKGTSTQDIFKQWHFYLCEDVDEKIITPVHELNQMYKYFSLEECLEEAKCMREINGFLYLGNDLWIINE